MPRPGPDLLRRVVVLVAVATAVAVVVAGCGPMVLVGAVLATGTLAESQTRTGPVCSGLVDPAASSRWPDDTVVGTPDQAQQQVATTIITTGQGRGLPAQAIVIALAVAAQESGWRNLSHGDQAGPDSRGVFQQRASWGPEAARMDPAQAAGLFYDALVKVPDWASLGVGQAGQRVQRSADSSGAWYAAHEPIARHALARLAAQPTSCTGQGQTGGMQCPPSRWPAVEQQLTPDAARVLRCATARAPSITSVGGVGDRPSNVDDDHQTGRAVDLMIPGWRTNRALGDSLAAWLWDNRQALGIKYVIWNARIISVARISEGWRSYQNPSGSSPTLQHLDHIHVSVYGGMTGTTGGAAPATTAGSSGGAGWVLPIAPGQYRLGTRFGVAGSAWKSGRHTGQDFPANEGTELRAVTSGKVTVAGWGGAYGWWTCHTADGTSGVTICYAHQSTLLVLTGQHVTAGQTIGRVGNTGNSFGPHLHFEVRVNGRAVDPLPVLADHGLTP